jgi:hypothetical protein
MESHHTDNMSDKRVRPHSESILMNSFINL